jgi:hypothetical protein
MLAVALAIRRDQIRGGTDNCRIRSALRHPRGGKALWRHKRPMADRQVDQGFVTLWLAQHAFGGRLSYIGYGAPELRYATCCTFPICAV